jgi:hypothetical protein
MSLFHIQDEVFRLARLGMSVGEISAHLRKTAKNAEQEPIPTSWVRAWMKNAGFAIRKSSK